MKTFPAFARVVTLDGQQFIGTPAQIVAAMREASRATPTMNVDAFRAQYAERALLWLKQPIRSADDVSFLSDLESVGLIHVAIAQGE